MATGDYNYCVPVSNNCFDFTVSATGTLDFAPALDAYVAGRGTSTLT